MAKLVVSLTRAALENDDDSAGRWQYEGGRVGNERGEDLGYYASTKRVIFNATDAQNTAMLNMTLFFRGSTPPENITVEGSHDFESGNQVGSVSAASNAYAAYIGRTFTRTGETVHIG